MRPVSKPPSEAPPARVAPLSVLPVFFDLQGKLVLVAGGTDAAAWKAELLAASGARVTVAAEEVGEEMANLLAADTVEHHPGVWSPALLNGVAMAVGDIEDPVEAQAFADAARRAGAPCNVIDNPSFCSFQFGTIVNRSPVVVGISTTGAAPILGQAVRRRIETLLPPSLAVWGALAQRLRDRVSESLAFGAPRRAFWERLVDRAFGPAPEPKDEAAVLASLNAGFVPERSCGHVTFVGAGPGEAGLLTLDAVRALQAADVILFDDLVSDEVLELARREAKRILVGKRAGRPSCKQEEITGLMVRLARDGRRVVRLKSGDPMIFGRAGEEIAALRAESLPFDVVPGITAGLTLAAKLGISLTHRNHAKSVRFVTGHSKAGGLPEDLDWQAVADQTTTTVFYMGGRTAGAISDRLIHLGLSPMTPACVGAALGRPSESIAVTTLGDLAAAVAQHDPRDPLVIGVGPVFGTAASMRHASPAEQASGAVAARA